MIIYSKKIIQFIGEIKSILRDVLKNEVRLKLLRDRFYDRNEQYSYPLKVVIYNNKAILGYFDSGFYELGFHECLMHTNKSQLMNIVRHEVAHYITFITHGQTAQPHSAEFKAFCQQTGWGEEVYQASMRLDSYSSGMEENGIFKKIQKLMALAASNNQYEAEQAMIKAQQLLLKHNIDAKYVSSIEEEKVFLKRIMKQKKENAKMRAIAKILETFFVNVVYSRSTEYTHLEIVGSAVNIEIAEYVAAFLDEELDKLWHRAQRDFYLKGALAKNSFFLGIARGYCDKIQMLKRGYTQDVCQALLVIEKQLTDARDMVYPRLSSRKSTSQHCHESAELGQIMGRGLQINPAVNNSSAQTLLISY